MKKILIAILLLVPLIVVLTINVGADIISAEIKIEMSSLKMMHLEEEVTYVSINLEDYVKDNKPYRLSTKCFPSNASNKEVRWYSTDDKIATVKPATMGNGAAVYFHSGRYGTVTIVAESLSNASVRATCTFYVVGEVVDRIVFREWDGAHAVTDINLNTYQTMGINADVVPSTALNDGKVEWKSEDPTIASVDANGMITAHRKGTVIVTASLNGVQGELEVTVQDDVMPCRVATVYTADDTADLSPYLAPGATVSDENGNSLGTSVDVSGGPREVIAALGSLTQTVWVQKCAANQLVVSNLYSMQQGMWSSGNFVEKDSANIQLSAVPALGGVQPVVTWSSSDPQVLSVDEHGVLHGKGNGVATVYASADGYADLAIEVWVDEVARYVNLELDAMDDARGLGQQRVFGVDTCYRDPDGNWAVGNRLPMRIASCYPAHLAQQNIANVFGFVSSDPALATVTDDGVVSFAREAIGHDVTITVYAKHTTNAVIDQYTFHLIDGINIGYGEYVEYDADADDEDGTLANSLNYNGYDQLMYVANEYKGDVEQYGTISSIVFQNNVYMRAGGDLVSQWRCISGNGYTYDGQLHATAHDTRMFESWIRYDWIKPTPMFEQAQYYDLVIQNLNVQSFYPISDDSEAAFTTLKKRGGIPLRLDEAVGSNIDGIHFTLRHCLFQYAYAHCNFAVGNILLDGCIFRNTAAPAILLQSYGESRYADVTLRNCIFSNIIAPALLSTTSDVTGSVEEKEQACYSLVRLEGNNYVYNWKLLDEVSLDIFPPTGKEAAGGAIKIDAIVESLRGKLDIYFRDTVRQPANADIVLHHPKGDYINFGFMVLGVWKDLHLQYNPDPDTLIVPPDRAAIPDPQEGYFRQFYDGFTVLGDPDRTSCFELDMSLVEERLPVEMPLYKVIKPVLTLDFDANKSYLVSALDANGDPLTQPGETYEIDAKTLARLHGEEE